MFKKILGNPDFEHPLIEMERMFRKVCNYKRADMLKEVIELLRTSPQEAIKELTSNTFWGGSGSFFDVVPDFSSEDTENDSIKHYYEILLDLLLNLRAAGFTHPWFNSREEMLRYFVKHWSKENK